MAEENRLLRTIEPGPERRGLLVLFVAMSFVLTAMPLWMSLQDVLTRSVLATGWYGFIQDMIVPYQLKLVAGLLIALGVPVKVGLDFLTLGNASGAEQTLHLAWNCVGWQTVVLLGITFISGLRGSYALGSKVVAILIGLLGTFVVNVVRLSVVVMFYYFGGRAVGQVFHDYSANLIALAWIFGYWWYIYTHILIHKYSTPIVTTG